MDHNHVRIALITSKQTPDVAMGMYSARPATVSPGNEPDRPDRVFANFVQTDPASALMKMSPKDGWTAAPIIHGHWLARQNRFSLVPFGRGHHVDASFTGASV